jgi:7,8-dihydropterin-6-yl-methyl-4-(beta-D-ribofuranosyl)aminobenzene 5'-phosphate synthase
MQIKVLSENTSISQTFHHEHGLSIYIETQEKKVLFDTGASELYLKNAQALGVDISDIDYLVLSHGHYDHGGGLKAFLRENEKAEIFLHRLAFEKYYAAKKDGVEYIGLDQELKDNKRFVFTSDRFFLSKGLQVFSNVVQHFALPMSNKSLLMEKDGEKVADTFSHEQSLIVEENGKTLLLTGCSHNGIRNILHHFQELKGKMPDVSIGGFHLSTTRGSHDSLESIDELGRYLLETGVTFYTGHCTGQVPFARLKEVMGEKIHYLPAGSVFTI